MSLWYDVTRILVSCPTQTPLKHATAARRCSQRMGETKTNYKEIPLYEARCELTRYAYRRVGEACTPITTTVSRGKIGRLSSALRHSGEGLGSAPGRRGP